MELRTLLDWVGRDQAAHRARRRRGQRHGRRGQAVPGGRSIPSGWPATACRWATSTSSSSEQRRRSAAATSRRTRESFVIRGDAQFQQHRGHRRTPSSPSDADGTPVLLKQRGATCSIGAGAALRRRHQARRGRDRRRHGDDADRRELARGGARRSRRGSPRSRRSCRAGVRDPRLLRPRRVHRPHAEAPSPSTWPRARCWSWWCCSSRSGSCRGALIAALAIPLAMGDRASSAWCGSASPATSCRSARSTSACWSTARSSCSRWRWSSSPSRRPQTREDVADAVAAGDAPGGAAGHLRRCSSSCSSTCRSWRSRASRGACSSRWRSPSRWRSAARSLFSLTAFPALAALSCLRAPKHAHDEHGRLRARCGALSRGCSTRCWRARGRCSARRAAAPGRRGRRRRALGAEFVPRLDEGELSLDIQRLPSISHHRGAAARASRSRRCWRASPR